MSTPAGKYSKSDLMKIFDLNYNQLDRFLFSAGSDLPVGVNFIDSRKIYTDETVKYLQEKYRLNIAVDPSKI